MSVAILDRTGQIVGWFEDEAILDLSMRPRGYLLDGGIFDYQGRYRGGFRDGVFTDLNGLVVGRLEGTSATVDSPLDWETYFRGKEPPPDESGPEYLPRG
jgi:hypothetical protein